MKQSLLNDLVKIAKEALRLNNEMSEKHPDASERHRAHARAASIATVLKKVIWDAERR